jgi:hypothetical protein
MSFERFKKNVINELRERAKSLVQRNYSKIRRAVKPVIVDAIYDCPEMESLRSGKLRYDLGVKADPTLLISWSVADTMKLQYAYSNQYIFNFSISIQPGRYENLLDLPQSVFISENGKKVPWLEWLLTNGTKVIMADFGVLYKEGAGRTDGAITVKNVTPFMIDPAFAGVSGDNFISRALNKNAQKIQQAAWQTLLI